jgi:MioC protein
LGVMILYGTESGNAELVADDMADAMAGTADVVTRDMSSIDIAELSPRDFILVICSTHGDGELPSGAIPFAEALDRERPDLSGIRYAVFGLGDSSYETYSRGSELIDNRLRALGAERVGPYGRHDASSREVASDVAKHWALAVLEGQAVA